MKNIRFLDANESVYGEVEKLSPHTVKITGEISPNISGFRLELDSGAVYGKYDGFTTLFKEIEGGFILSDDGSIYVEPEPMPEPEPVPEQTLEEVQEAKVAEMNDAQQKMIQEGINVTLTNGTIEHFTLTDHDQTSLVGLQAQVLAGEENIPWHTSDETEHCKFYSNADMELITAAAMAYVTWHVTYFRDLRIYIRSLADKATIESIRYGVEIPDKYKSDVLKAMEVA